MMEKILLVARNVFRGILYRRILYLWVAAIFLLILRAAPALLFNFGNEALQTVMRRRAVSGALDTWSTLCIALAIFMGASAISSENAWKTIATALARPVRRWEFLVGKWIGVQCFALLSLLLGLLVGFGLSIYLDAEFEFRILGISVAQTAAAIMLYSGLAIAVSTLVTPGMAGAVTILIAFLPGFVTYLAESPGSFKHAAGVVLDYAIPPGYTSHYAGTIRAALPPDAFNFRNGPGRRRGEVPPFVAQTSPDPEIKYDAEYRELIENIGYAMGFFALGCFVFSHRDLRLT
jgi:ABC-type transport system involved in multi-copper enzyme maturation permease subunit